MPQARASLAAVASSKGLLAIGGSGVEGAVVDVDRFDGMMWSRETTLPEGVNAAAAAAVGDDVYVIGGFAATGNAATDRVRIYNLRTRDWRAGAAMPTARGGIQAVVLNGRIHVVGGGNQFSVLGAHEAYDPSTNRWQALAPLPTPRGNPALAVLNGKLYAIGGGAGGQAFTAVDVYDPACATWSPGPALPSGRIAARAVAYRNTLFVFGGENGSSISDVVLRLNAAGTSWEEATAMPAARSYAGAANVNDAVYIAGGSQIAPTLHGSAGTPTVQRFYVR